MLKLVMQALVCLVVLASTPVGAIPEITQDDYVVILVDGSIRSCPQWGFSGAASLYVASGSGAGSLDFEPVAEKVAVERRSAQAVGHDDFYGPKGHIPPGIYFLHYHRFDESHGGRHRLGLADEPCGPSSAPCDETLPALGSGNVQRKYLQFHVAYNNLEEYKADVNEGCIVSTRDQFSRLFPEPFLRKETSPLSSGGHGTGHVGSGRVLVFVTTPATAHDDHAQGRQLELFHDLLSGGLAPGAFQAGASLEKLRQEWLGQNPLSNLLSGDSDLFNQCTGP